MARLYIFAIGGTGSRVLKSLTMLLAAGVKPKTKIEYEIVPIVIDPHVQNEDLKRTQRLLSTYQAITDEVGFNNGFFATKISTLNKITPALQGADGSFTFDLQDVANTKFKDYIAYDEMDDANKALSNILFSGTSIDSNGEQVDLLDVKMDIGFVGNPNIGSVVLDQFKDSKEFLAVANNFSPEDRIFIISSIFGGTGAAGFPTILKNIRDAYNNVGISTKDHIKNAKIGALTVFPYFNIEPKVGSPIRPGDFICKTKSALQYYAENINLTNEAKINAMYYIGDDFSGNPIGNDPGNDGQKNDAHVIELISALSIIDFLETESSLKTVDGIATNPVYKEFGMRNDTSDIRFSDFNDKTEKQIALPLAQLAMFKKYMDEQLEVSIENQVWSIDAPTINKTFKGDIFFNTHISDILKEYDIWLIEMKGSGRGFNPLDTKTKGLQSFINGRPLEPKSRIPFKKNNYFDFDSFEGKLNECVKNKTFKNGEEKLVKLFFDTTQEILTTKYSLTK